MHVEPLCRVREHPRSRPLLRPKANLRENPFVASDKFAKQSSVPLRMNFSRENFHAWDPGFLNLTLVAVRADKFTGVQAPSRKCLCEIYTRILTRLECFVSTRILATPTH